MFKKCTNCGYIWENREDFLADPDIEIIGYQALFKEIKDGLFLFNHMCETTLATNVIDFNDLYKGPVFDMSLADLDACGAECKYAYVRDIIQIIKNWPKIKHKSPEFA
jgi:hypothetical protein